jgi:ubiquinone/menaquinone biosynthesis C-methylase UbiE
VSVPFVSTRSWPISSSTSRCPGRHRGRRRRDLALLKLEPDIAVLDLAWGQGRIANRLAERGARVTGLDATALFLDRARHDAAPRGDVDYVEGDMRLLRPPSAPSPLLASCGCDVARPSPRPG